MYKIPSTYYRFCYGNFCIPTENFSCEGGVGIYRGQISRASVADCVGDEVFARDSGIIDDFEHARTLSSPDIDRVKMAPLSSEEFRDSGEVCLREIVYVDVIADPGTIGGIVVISVDIDFSSLAYCDIENIGEEIIRNPGRAFSNISRRVRSNRIEIPQSKCVPEFGR